MTDTRLGAMTPLHTSFQTAGLVRQQSRAENFIHTLQSQIAQGGTVEPDAHLAGEHILEQLDNKIATTAHAGAIFASTCTDVDSKIAELEQNIARAEDTAQSLRTLLMSQPSMRPFSV